MSNNLATQPPSVYALIKNRRRDHGGADKQIICPQKTLSSLSGFPAAEMRFPFPLRAGRLQSLSGCGMPPCIQISYHGYFSEVP